METNNKLREACANIAEYARSAMCHTTDAHVLGYLNQIEGWAKAALAEPVRNCDRFKNADEAIEAVDTHCEHAANGCIGCPAVGCRPHDADCRIAGLFAPAAEKEGGAK